MEICTIGFTQKRAAQFFGALREAGIRRLVDVRLNNSSQLAGFTKREDLAFFLHELCDAGYVHELQLAPTQEMLDAYKKHGGTWATYETMFRQLLVARRVETAVSRDLFGVPAVLLCSEATAEHCHRRVVAEYLRDAWGDVTIRHL